MSGGALTAVTDEAEAAWYNPAGVAAVLRSRVSLTGGSLIIRLRSRPSMLEAELPGSVETAGDQHIYTAFLPVGMGYARAITDRISIGGVAFLRDRDQYETHASMIADPTMTGGIELALPTTRFGVLTQRRKLDFGAAVAWQVTPRLRLGVTFFGNLEVRAARITLLHEAEGAESSGEGLHQELQHDFTTIQGFMLLGLQWQIADRWHLGLVWRSSEVSLWSKDDLSSPAAFAALEPVLGSSTTQRVRNGGGDAFETVQPPLMRIALAYRSERWWMNLELEYSPPHRDDGRGQDQEALWNVRAGARFLLTPSFSLGLGIFTANSSLERPNGILEPAVDYYGLAGGLQLRRSHTVSGRSDPLVFSTTIGFRYALGLGNSRGLRYDPTDLGAPYETGSDTAVVNHDITMSFGTGVLF